MAPEVTDGKDNSGNPSASTTVSMEEFTSLKSSMETRMDTLNELLTKLLEAQSSSLPATPLPLAPPPKDVSNEEVKEDSGENSSKTEVPPTKPLNGSGEYARVPFPNSPDLPIAHMRLNSREEVIALRKKSDILRKKRWLRQIGRAHV